MAGQGDFEMDVNKKPRVQRADGVTNAERYLKRLCDKTFLSLWSYPSIYRDQGRAGKGDGKELCDLLVVFDNDIIIFSDKLCEFLRSGNLSTRLVPLVSQYGARISQSGLGGRALD